MRHLLSADERDHRASILTAIRQEPGLTVQDLMRIVGCGRSSIRHHLDALCQARLVRLESLGNRTSIFPTEYRPSAAQLLLMSILSSPTRTRIARALATGEPLLAEALAERVFLSRRLVGYHLQALTVQGLVEKWELDGGGPARYVASSALASALRDLPAPR